MIYIADETLDRYLKEDIPYLDLTTFMLDIGDTSGKLTYYCREETILCGTEEVERICDKLHIKVNLALPSGEKMSPGTTFFEATGKAKALHKLWKVGLNILEYSSGIATRTRRLVDKITAANHRTTLVTTRKNFPGTKELATKSVLAGGGIPHRLGLSETILIFKQHRNFLTNNLADSIRKIQERVCEKKVLAEVEKEEEAVALTKAGIDGVQFDKVSVADLRSWVPKLREINPHLTILAAGGINESNAEDYARTGINAVVTTAVYFGKPADLGTTIQPI